MCAIPSSISRAVDISHMMRRRRGGPFSFFSGPAVIVGGQEEGNFQAKGRGLEDEILNLEEGKKDRGAQNELIDSLENVFLTMWPKCQPPTIYSRKVTLPSSSTSSTFLLFCYV